MGELLRSLMSKVRRMTSFGILPSDDIDNELKQLIKNLENKGLNTQEAINKLADCELSNRNTESTKKYLTIITK